MKSAHRPALRLFIALLFLAPALRAEDSADVGILRTKAEQGNSIAQYNLGLAYANGNGTEIDLPEAFVWLTLAADNGTKGPALDKTLDALSPVQLSEAKRRLDTRRTAKEKTAAPAPSLPTVQSVKSPGSAAITPAIDVAALQTQLAEAHQNISQLTLKNEALAAAAISQIPSAASPDTAKLSETEDKLATSLRSYTLLRDENDELKTSLEKVSTEKTSFSGQLETAQAAIAGLNEQLTASNATAAQATALRNQLRQTQDQLAVVSRENNELRGRLAASGPGSSTLLSSPTRPGATPTALNVAPLPVFESEHSATLTVPLEAITPVKKTEPVEPAIDTSVERTHLVAEGETLSGIALRYYGKSVRWAEILEANRTSLRDEKSLRVGMQLRIPVLK